MSSLLPYAMSSYPVSLFLLLSVVLHVASLLYSTCDFDKENRKDQQHMKQFQKRSKEMIVTRWLTGIAAETF
jgi:hypothetical protein